MQLLKKKKTSWCIRLWLGGKLNYFNDAWKYHLFILTNIPLSCFQLFFFCQHCQLNADLEIFFLFINPIVVSFDESSKYYIVKWFLADNFKFFIWNTNEVNWCGNSLLSQQKISINYHFNWMKWRKVKKKEKRIFWNFKKLNWLKLGQFERKTWILFNC